MIIQKQNSSKNFSKLGRTLQFVAHYLAPQFHTLDPINLNNLFPQEKDILQQEVFNKIDIKTKEMIPASSTTSPQNIDELGGFLSLMEKLRQENKISFLKKNQTIITGSKTTPNTPKISEVTEVFDEQAFYNQYGPHTQVTGLQSKPWEGWVDFFVTQDNEIILSPRNESIHALLGEGFESLDRYVDPLFLSSGTLIKTAGKIRVEQHNGVTRIILAPESDFWSVNHDEMLHIVRDIFEQNGCFTADNFFFLNKKNGISLKIENYVPNKFLIPVNNYLNANHFPVQSESTLSIEQAISEKLKVLFWAIDDAVLSSKNATTIIELFSFSLSQNEPQQNLQLSTLKKSIAHFFLLMMKVGKFLNSEEDNLEIQQANDSLQRILTLLKEIQEQYKINVDFIFGEICSLQLYSESIKRQESQNNQEEKLDLQNFEENVCQSSRRSAVIALNWRDPQIKRFLQFYEKNPVQTLINLLRDYTKNNSWFKRFITGAWNRHYVSQVESFLDKYDRGEISDGGSVKAILDHLFPDGLPKNFLSGILSAMVNFGAVLNGEPEIQLKDRMQLESETLTQEEGELSRRSSLSQMSVKSSSSEELLLPPPTKTSGNQVEPEENTTTIDPNTADNSSRPPLVIPLASPSSEAPSVKDISNADSSATELSGSVDSEKKVMVEQKVTVEQKSKNAEPEEEVAKNKIENQESVLSPLATVANATLIGGAGLFVTPKKQSSVKDSKPQSEDLMSSLAESDVETTASLRK